MIAQPDSTASTMKSAIAHSIVALDAAAELDVDRTAEDRAFFAAEKAALQPRLDAVVAAEQAHEAHVLLAKRRLQIRTVLGDLVLDRGARTGKARMKLGLSAEKADQVFPGDIEEIVDAERRVEPDLVLQVVERFAKVPDFAGKAELAQDLKERAERQKKCFTERDAGEVVEAALEAALEKAIQEGSDALYRLEKRLLERFPREKRYVRAFFLDVAPERKKPAGAKGGGAPPA